MTGDYTLADLAADADLADADESGSSSNLLDTVQYLDENGYLQQLLAASNLGPNGGGKQPGSDGPMNAEQARAAVGGEQLPSTDGGQKDSAPSLDADNIAQFGKLVIDEFGDVPVSQVVKIAEANPGQVNQAIQQQLGLSDA
jgi:hypothetical protein